MSRRPPAVAMAALCCLGMVAARADERPLTLPSRDVDVTYAMTRPDGPPDQPRMAQRVRWAQADQKLRVDTPSPGLYVVMDYRTHLLSAVRPAERMVLQVKSNGADLSLGGARIPEGGFARTGESMVAGLACTQWRTRDAAGEATLACLTADGVLLRAEIGKVALVEAVRVAYGPIDKSVFDVPADYRRIAAPTRGLAGPPP